MEFQYYGHHTAISVSDVEKTIEFYEHFEFSVSLRWQAEDDSLDIVHMKLGSQPLFLEIFAYKQNRQNGPLDLQSGNDLTERGVKHLGLRVEDLGATRKRIEKLGLVITETKRGRTGIDFFFVRDPDGLWLEIVQDERNL